MKFRNISASFAVVSLGKWCNRSPIEIGVKFCPGWSCSISLIDSAVMVKSTVWFGEITAHWLGMYFAWQLWTIYGNICTSGNWYLGKLDSQRPILSAWFMYWSLYWQYSLIGDSRTYVSLIWKSLSTRGRWSKSWCGVEIGLISIAIGAAILSFCGSKNGEGKFSIFQGKVSQF